MGIVTTIIEIVKTIVDLVKNSKIVHTNTSTTIPTDGGFYNLLSFYALMHLSTQTNSRAISFEYLY